MLVAVRMRPLWQKEDDAGDHRCVSVLQGKVVNVTDPWYDEVLNPNRQKEKRYAFDIVFDDDVGQLEVFEKTSKGLVSGVLDGYNASVFAYGATGAGKTHTMLGSLEEPGIMVKTLHEIYGAMEADFQDSKFKVTLSYVEIYNEVLYDLLAGPSALTGAGQGGEAGAPTHAEGELQIHEDQRLGCLLYTSDAADE